LGLALDVASNAGNKKPSEDGFAEGREREKEKEKEKERVGSL
jgi:hypothetical protein